MKPCKHLDYEENKFDDCELRTMAPHYPEVRYWFRGPRWTDNGPGKSPNPAKCQFCGAGIGRINGVFQCYQPGEMPCYEPTEEAKP